MGFGAAALGIAVQSTLLARWFGRSLTTAIAIVSGAAGIGVMTFSPVTQYLIDDLGWRNAYIGIAIIVASLGVITLFAPWRRIARGHPDLMDRQKNASSAPLEAWTFKRAVRSRPYWALTAVHFHHGYFHVFCPAHRSWRSWWKMVSIRSLPPAPSGVSGISATVGLLVFGVIADRYGALISVTLSYSLTIFGYVLLTALAIAPSTFLLWAFVILYGASFGSRGPVISALTARIFGRGPDLGLIMGAIFMGMGSGAAVGATLGGLIHDVTEGYAAVIALALGGNLHPRCHILDGTRTPRRWALAALSDLQ